MPEVSFDADPDSGFAVYDSVWSGGRSGWFQIGGTSAAAPAWAGLVAIADQGLATEARGPLSTTQLMAGLYSVPSSDFHDITSGSNGYYSAQAGFDLVTGLGTPKANLLVADLLASPIVPDPDPTDLSDPADRSDHTNTSDHPDTTDRTDASPEPRPR